MPVNFVSLYVFYMYSYISLNKKSVSLMAEDQREKFLAQFGFNLDLIIIPS